MATLTKKQTLPALGADSNGMLMTPREFDAVEDYDENYRYELINGVVIVIRIPDATEAGPNDLLAHYLLDYQLRHPQGASLDYTLPQQFVRLRQSRRIADRLIWAGLGRLPDLTDDAPTIAVEFVSAGKRSQERDYIHKKRDYAKSGMKEYWIIDRFRRVMTVVPYRARTKELVVAEHETYETPLLPGFQLLLAQILQAADRAEQTKRARKRAR